jgi:hypothetical protein
LAHGDDAEVIAAKQRLDMATTRIEGKKAEISEKERLLDQAQGREAEESRRRQVEQDFERATERLNATQAEIARLKTQHLALPEKIRLAEWHFHEALRAFIWPKKLRRMLSGNRSTLARVRRLPDCVARTVSTSGWLLILQTTEKSGQTKVGIGARAAQNCPTSGAWANNLQRRWVR